MKFGNSHMTGKVSAATLAIGMAFGASAMPKYEDLTFKAGDASLQHWLMPKAPPHPENNEPTEARVELGKMLFFDPRLSGDGNMSCATCHSPLFGWSDGQGTAKGFQSKVLGRATPTVVNTGYQSIQMWDGRKKTLEDQALGPMVSGDEMNIGVEGAMKFVTDSKVYRDLFKKAYPERDLDGETLAMALASFERTVISTNSPFDQWVKGDKSAMSKAQVEGFKAFVDPERGNCAVCHSAPNFTDDSFHNIGLPSYGMENPDMGRYAIKPIRILKGAFKTPTLREISNTAPYFHDGSSKTLEAVVDHYVKGGEVKKDLSPFMKPLKLSKEEKNNIVEFLKALSGESRPFELPVIPPQPSIKAKR